MTTVNLQQFRLTLAGGEQRVLDVSGRFVRLFKASLTDFEIGFDDNQLVAISQGVAFEPEADFSRLRLRNPNANSITVTLYVGRGRVFDDRNVSDVPQGTDPQTLGEHQDAYFASYNVHNVGAMEYCSMELRNPAASGKVLLIHQLQLYASIASSAVFLRLGSAGDITSTPLAEGNERFADGASSVVENYAETDSTVPDFDLTQIWQKTTSTTGEITELNPPRAYALNEGRSLYYYCRTLNSDLRLFALVQEVNA